MNARYVTASGMSGCLACVLISTSAIARDVEVGVNPRTGEAILMPVPAKHPVLAVQCPGWYADRLEKMGADRAVGELRQRLGKLLGSESWSKGEQNYLLWVAAAIGQRKLLDAPAYTELLDSVLTEMAEKGKAGQSAFASLFALMRRQGSPTREQLSKHSVALKAAILPDGKLAPASLSLEAADVVWDLDVLSRKEKELITARLVSPVPQGWNSSCNNGRWCWVKGISQAAVLEQPELMRLALDDLKHWLGHDIFPDGGGHDNVSYDYCHSRRPGIFEGYRSYFTNFDPSTFAVPSLPDSLNNNRDGFVDPLPKNLGERKGVAWRTVGTYANWKRNRAAPDGSLFTRGDTHPQDVATADGPRQPPEKGDPPDVPLLSESLTSLLILRGGGHAEDYDHGLRETPNTWPERLRMIYACLDGASTDACHNHANMLQLLIWGKGRWLAEDNGCQINWLTGTYDRELGTYGYKTYAHNTVTVDQLEQYVSNSTALFFGDQPGFRVAAMDAGHVYDGVYHQRTVAMTDRYLVDLNLLPARGDAQGQAHTFDYMLQGTGEFVPDSIKIKPEKADWGRADANAKGLDAYLQWPNLEHIYPYIRWYAPYLTTSDWEATWGLNGGPHLRVMFANAEKMRLSYGMADLGIRGATNFRTQVNGVPKILARRTGAEGKFLTVLEPYETQSAVLSFTRLDGQAVKVALTDGAEDYVLLQRTNPSYVFLSAREGRVAAVRFFEGKGLSVDGKALLSCDAEGVSAGVEFRSDQVLVAAACEKPCRLNVLCEGTVTAAEGVERAEGGFAVRLQAGRSRIVVKGENLQGPELAAEALAGLTEAFPLRAPKEVDPYYSQDRAERLWQETYSYPRIYHDGAYKGQAGTDCHWSVDVTDEGRMVTGTHFGTVECFDVSGKKLWIYKTDGRCATNLGWNPWYFPEPLHIKDDGSRVVAGSEDGTVHLLDGDGRFLWRTAVGARVNEVCPNTAWDRFAVATDQGLSVLGQDGRKLAEVPTPGRALQVKLADNGTFAGLFHGQSEQKPELEKVANVKTAGRSTVVVACFEPDGKMKWQAESPGFGEFKTKEAQQLASGSLCGHGFQSIDMTPDGRRLVAGSTNYSVYCYEPNRGKLLWSTEPVDESARSIRISDDGKTVAFCGGGGLVCCDGKGRRLWHYRTPFSGYACDMTADGNRISVTAATGVVYVLERGKAVVTRSPVHTVEPMVTSLSPNGRYTAVGAIGYDLLMLKNP